MPRKLTIRRPASVASRKASKPTPTVPRPEPATSVNPPVVAIAPTSEGVHVSKSRFIDMRSSPTVQADPLPTVAPTPEATPQSVAPTAPVSTTTTFQDVVFTVRKVGLEAALRNMAESATLGDVNAIMAGRPQTAAWLAANPQASRTERINTLLGMANVVATGSSVPIGTPVPRPEPDTSVRATPIPPSPTVQSAPTAARFTELTLRARSIPALKQMCKDLGYPRYSALNKDQLVILILSNGQRRPAKDDVVKVKTPTAADLKAACKAAGFTRGLSTLNRAELVKTLEDGVVQKHAHKPGTVGWLKWLAGASQYNIKNRSKMSSQELINALLDTDAASLLIEHGMDQYRPKTRRQAA